MQARIPMSFLLVYFSPNAMMDRPNVKSDEVDDRMVLDVTYVIDKDMLKVN